MSTEIIEALLAMKRQQVMDLIQQKINIGENPFAILKACQEAMEQVGKRFETGEFFLSELIYSAEIFKAVSAYLEPMLIGSLREEESRGSIIFGTPQGDIHDLGKNIVITLMRASGFTVHDLGVDVPPQKFIQALKETGSQILAMSAIITPAYNSMRETIELLKEFGLREKTFVIVGGVITNDLVRHNVGADAQTLDPFEGVRLCKEYVAKKAIPHADYR